MMLGVVALTSLLTWVVTTWTLSRQFDEIGRAIIEDDLAEYGAFYERRSVKAVEKLFITAGHGEQDQGIRLLDPSGTPLIDRPIPTVSGDSWPDFERHPLAADGGIDWHRIPLQRGTSMTIGRRLLTDGSELWFARTNQADLDAITHIHNLLLIAIGASIALAVGPIVWFANHVLQPVQAMIGGTRQLTSSPCLRERLVSPPAIPELRDFAQAFNESSTASRRSPKSSRPPTTSSPTNCAPRSRGSAAMSNASSPPREPGMRSSNMPPRPSTRSPVPLPSSARSSASAPATPASCG